MKCIHFYNYRKRYYDPILKLVETEIEMTDQHKLLGIDFDKKNLTFIPCLKYLKQKCFKILQLLRIVANTDWGVDCLSLLKLYQSLIRSKLDYGCFIYGMARKSYLKILDPIHHTGLRLALVAFKTSPIESLYVKAHEAPLN